MVSLFILNDFLTLYGYKRIELIENLDETFLLLCVFGFVIPSFFFKCSIISL